MVFKKNAFIRIIYIGYAIYIFLLDISVNLFLEMRPMKKQIV